MLSGFTHPTASKLGVARRPLRKVKIREEQNLKKMAAATARPIPVVNNVMTDEDFDNLRTEGKVRTFFMQRNNLI